MKGHFQRSNFSIFFFTGMLAVALLSFWMHSSRVAEKAKKSRSVSKELVKASHDQEFQKFNLTGFDNKGKTFWNLEGNTARVQPSQTIYLDNNVTFKLKDNTVIHTDHVQWSQSEGLMQTDALVTLDHDVTHVTGTGAIGRPSQSFIQLNRDIKMNLSRTGTLTCQGPMKVYYNENKMVFYRKVKVVDERGTLSANRMDVFFDPNEKKIKQIIAVGDVVITRGTDTTHSRRAIYTLATGSVRLEGNPEITMYKNPKGVLNGTFGN